MTSTDSSTEQSTAEPVVAATPKKSSKEALQTAEELLPQLNVPALQKLTAILESKITSVKHDLRLLGHQEHSLKAIQVELQKNKETLENEKKKAADALKLMRDNLCSIPGFTCQKLEYPPDDIVNNPLRNQWLEKARMLEEMNSLVQNDIKQDLSLRKNLQRNEKAWRKMMHEYLECEREIVAGQRRLDELCARKCVFQQKIHANQEQIGSKSREKMDLSPMNGSLHEQVMEDFPDKYTMKAVSALADGFADYQKTTGDFIETLRDAANQLEGFEEVRRHILALISANAAVLSNQPDGKRKSNLWEQIQACSVKEDELALLNKIKNMKDMIGTFDEPVEKAATAAENSAPVKKKSSDTTMPVKKKSSKTTGQIRV